MTERHIEYLNGSRETHEQAALRCWSETAFPQLGEFDPFIENNIFNYHDWALANPRLGSLVDLDRLLVLVRRSR